MSLWVHQEAILNSYLHTPEAVTQIAKRPLMGPFPASFFIFIFLTVNRRYLQNIWIRIVEATAPISSFVAVVAHTILALR